MLAAFVSVISMPTALAAVNFTCDMEMSHSAPVCCVSMDVNSNQEKRTEDCDQQAFCAQEVQSSPSEIPAVTQYSKVVIAAELFKELVIVELTNDHPPVIEDEPSSLQYHPPIFLLNSTFLN
jgi:hypothetical protein